MRRPDFSQEHYTEIHGIIALIGMMILASLAVVESSIPDVRYAILMIPFAMVVLGDVKSQSVNTPSTPIGMLGGWGCKFSPLVSMVQGAIIFNVLPNKYTVLITVIWVMILAGIFTFMEAHGQFHKVITESATMTGFFALLLLIFYCFVLLQLQQDSVSLIFVLALSLAAINMRAVHTHQEKKTLVSRTGEFIVAFLVSILALNVAASIREQNVLSMTTILLVVMLLVVAIPYAIRFVTEIHDETSRQ